MSPQRPLSERQGRAWPASVPLKWYPHSFVILRSASSQPGGEQSLVLQRHILTCSATKHRFITLQSSSCQPDDALTLSHPLAPPPYLIGRFLEGIRNNYGKVVEIID
ncbi:Cysteine--tRNA ligase [Dissostichus eleginoides]|uniref:Cysteine--tRNA ligase n=1 Tax=Dissostichus eleginoides TaxID=100907 RepID=A0AAD9CBY9_DISEL|nr:Cysteine--tRNA ligase [Dissostichus eleginoides]